jgi:hypothetical protein
MVKHVFKKSGYEGNKKVTPFFTICPFFQIVSAEEEEL